MQAFHRHIPILIRALGSSCTELLTIVSDPPEGSENLLVLVCCFSEICRHCYYYPVFLYINKVYRWFSSAKVLQVLTQETTPSPDLLATVKHLYETKLKVSHSEAFSLSRSGKIHLQSS